MTCDCNSFRIDLINLCKEVLSQGGGQRQWETFEQSLRKYIEYYCSHDTSIFMNEIETLPYYSTTDATSCSLKICSALANKLDELKRSYTALSNFFVDLLTVFHSDRCAESYVETLWDSETNTSFSTEREAHMLLGVLRCHWSSDYMKLLVNFGLLSSLSGDSSQLRLELDCEHISFVIQLTLINPARADVMEVLMKLIKDIFFWYEEPEFIKRMFFVVWAVRAIRRKMEQDQLYVAGWAEQTISCLRMYFTATRDAYLSVFEMRSILYVFFMLTNNLHLFDVYCQEFHELMPECPATVEPRKLTHLARWQIRENLKTSQLPLPAAVEKLILPKNLQKFLLGDIADISRKGDNTSSQKFVTQSELASLVAERSTF